MSDVTILVFAEGKFKTTYKLSLIKNTATESEIFEALWRKTEKQFTMLEVVKTQGRIIDIYVTTDTADKDYSEQINKMKNARVKHLI